MIITIIYVIIAFLFGIYCGNSTFRGKVNTVIKNFIKSAREKAREEKAKAEELSSYEKAVNWNEVKTSTLQKIIQERKITK
jgi:hypothetical protein